ncbi:HAD-IC family P-type ATPase [Streptomyces sp. OF3]|uniref:HAD-IC family P-type ATPase n=1 Tax=Streptomyces alkaliterrae TaxID=2213162 RepID=A0A7W3WKL0_9ACTN|nr:HAD-IC family P-type ATPase [Streptomyces alkaliterrae]MBB1254009.1 HAD-IC family P-type ATPase [Streptomyces alkaliterrae]
MTTTVDAKGVAGNHHGLAAHEVVLLLATDPERGLSRQEAERRMARFGPNVLPAAARRGPLLRVLAQFHHPLIYVLLAAGAITAGIGEYVDASVIFAVVLINAAIGFIQESKAEAALDSLRSMQVTTATVVRDGRERQVPSEELVPGDLVVVEAGDKAPADLRLLRGTELRTDESALTGESEPVAKDEAVLDVDTPVADRRNTVHSGTLVTSGRGVGIAVATGGETEIGEIHRLVGAADTLATPLTAKLADFSKLLTVVILLLAGVTFAFGMARGEEPVHMFTAAVALAVGAIPEGLPAAVTITLAIGVARMARRRAVIRRLPAVETLGSTTVICSDKTGTLTENQMTVTTVWTPERTFRVTGTGYAPAGGVHDLAGTPARPADHPSLRWTLLVGGACNDATLAEEGGRWHVVGDPTEGALLALARKGGVNGGRPGERLPRVAAVPFSSDRRYMATLHRDVDGGDGADGHVLLLKGAVERVAALCEEEFDADGRRRPLDRSAVLRAADELAGTGLRVLATAIRPGVGPDALDDPDSPPTGLVLTGLVAMFDPPRAAAVDAVRACHTAGVAVKMITGDHVGTASAIASQLGLLPPPTEPGRTADADGTAPRPLVLTGAELAALPPDAYADAVDHARVFARVSPEQKLRLVEALQQRGHVVAMTGDGVNDAPALRQANIGVAMGEGGTEVAKDSADMVLTDDDFATIEAAVEEGRGVFDNLTKFIVWTLPTSMGQGLVILAAVLAGATLPIMPTQILWINMTTAVALGLMLAFEPKEREIMTRPPRDPARPLLTVGLTARIALVSALMVIGAWWIFNWERSAGVELAEARTAAVNLLVAVQVVYLFSCRSLTRPVWRLGFFSNPWVIGGVLVQLAGQLLITYTPVMNALFGTAPIDAGAWLRVAAFAALASAVIAADKHFRPRVM